MLCRLFPTSRFSNSSTSMNMLHPASRNSHEHATQARSSDQHTHTRACACIPTDRSSRNRSYSLRYRVWSSGVMGRTLPSPVVLNKSGRVVTRRVILSALSYTTVAPPARDASSGPAASVHSTAHTAALKQSLRSVTRQSHTPCRTSRTLHPFAR